MRTKATDNIPCGHGICGWQIRVISPHVEITLDVPGDGPGVLTAALMRGAVATAYVQGAVPPPDGRIAHVAVPSPTYKGKK